VAASFNVRGPARGLRRNLKNACLAEQEGGCLFVRPNRWGKMGPDGQHDLLRPVYAAYSNATFCLQPPGDAISRKGVVDALLLGCIPVFFHPDQVRQWGWHFSWGAKASITLPLDAAGEVMQRLAAVPIGEVRRMQQAIRRHAGMLSYRLRSVGRGRKDDAFAILLRALHLHARERIATSAHMHAHAHVSPISPQHQHQQQASPHQQHQRPALPAEPSSDVSSIDAFTSAEPREGVA